jgi:hypothetical protein
MGFLFFPQPFDFVCEPIYLVAQSGIVVRLLRDRVWLLGVAGFRPEQRRVGQDLIGEEESLAERRISEARIGSNEQVVMVPEAGIDEKRMPEPPRRHEANASSGDAARSRHHSGRRRSHAGSNADWGSCGKSALGLEAGREDRDRPQYRKQEQAAHA